MITCDVKTYQEEVMTHCKHAKFLNKMIEMYDELVIVVVKDMATGSFAKSYIDLNTQQKNGDDIEIVAENGKEGVMDKGEKEKDVVESSTTGSIVSKSCKEAMHLSVMIVFSLICLISLRKQL
nr:hypothetical protein CFP56_62954 [Quercus suber]